MITALTEAMHGERGFAASFCVSNRLCGFAAQLA
jgi:hypothetical protein